MGCFTDISNDFIQICCTCILDLSVSVSLKMGNLNLTKRHTKSRRVRWPMSKIKMKYDTQLSETQTVQTFIPFQLMHEKVFGNKHS